ncbi:LOW QUALITY PROTEIN: probable LRR receptor-like serine/threonine-protein kinase At1g05700 [Herrania umbratica]|uniref:non-specific serine/threonine protein kinase n=1 Tax=Herrania umbratica TaxID=108875 RepID=A0A6J1B5Q4_9ROSI|nr:LOW QUALITY PROTEIN: probable LRR receptor-like serine/threonine-protein kinase At1g05700 [Herrania umbratica]
MEMLNHVLLAFIISSIAFAILVPAQLDQSGFVSLDCGLPEDSNYTEATTGIDYVSDAAYVETGVAKSVLPEFQTGMQRQMWHVRSFPEGDRNCYNLTLTKGDQYLIVASFMYGNYDGLNEVPQCDLHLGPNLWGTVTLQNASTAITMDIIHVLQANHLHVCLVNTGNGIPFISALEFRLLKNTTYRTQTGSLELFTRYDVGSTTGSTFRFEEDAYDRIWWPYERNDWTQISTSSTVGSEDDKYQPPSLAMRTAGTPVNVSHSLDFFIDSSSVPNAQFYLFMHFAEVEKLLANESRAFNISYNGKHWYGPLSPAYLSSTTLYTQSALTGGQYQFSIYKTADSTHPPILNAIEIYMVKEFLQSETIQKEVEAISNIKSIYGLKRNWQGDPCAPQAYSWEGLNCSYDGYNSPTIISLNLSSSGLTGEIPPYIANLTQLQHLDLSNNSLTGAVPEFLSHLQSLTLLNLKDNKLNGTVPAGLIERSKNGLLLSVEGNSNLCASLSCKKKKKKKTVVVPIAASVASFAVLVIAFATLWRLKRRKPPLGPNMDDEYQNSAPSPEPKNRQFTFSEVQRMTNNFERILGKGGFGTVFHGYLDDTQVAVKMLSHSSVQGNRQFQAEVELLLRVHHRNLTSLIGYCKEGTNMGLIYEYMAKGNLAEHLSDRSNSILSWEGRLQTVLEAAQGLEYLHNGCQPSIIHRDMKCTNILLNENLQAKLADFGLSKTFPVEGGTHVSASIAGTPGYLDPEYYTSNRLTKKSDVYSFGIVVLEIITGRPVISEINNERTHISHWVSSMLSRGDIKNIVDPRLQGDFDVNSVWKAVEVAMTCVSPSSTRRPTMTQVVVDLNQCLSTKRARTMRGHENESQDSIGMMTKNFGTKLSPLPR